MGCIAGEPYLKSGWDSHGVDVVYEVKFGKPVLAASLRSDPGLGSMLIFRAPQATNFLLQSGEAKRLVEVLRRRDEKVPSLTEGGA